MATTSDAGLRRSYLPTFYDQDNYAAEVAAVEANAQAEAAQDAANLTEVGKGLRRGALNLRSTVSAAQAIPDLLLGDEAEAAQDLGEAQRLQEQAAQFPGRVERVEDINGVEDAADWLAGAFGSQVPNLGLAVAGGGVGALAARVGLRSAVGTATEGALARALPLAQKLAPATAKEAAERAAAYAGSRAATQRLASGAATGVAATSYPPLAGENLLAFNAENEGATPGTAALAAAAAIPQTLLERVTPMKVLDNLGLTRQFERAARNSLPPGLLQRTMRATGEGAVTEGLTETAQQAIQLGMRKVINKNLDLLSDEALSELLNSFAAGAVVGGGFGGGSQALGDVTQRIFAQPEGGKVSQRLEALEDGELGVAAHQSSTTTPDEVQKLLGRVLRDDSGLDHAKISEILTEHINSPGRSTPDDVAFLQELLTENVKPEFASAIDGITGMLAQKHLYDENEGADIDDGAEQVETSFEESSDPRATSTIEPGERRYYGDEKLTEDEKGNKGYVPTALHEQLFQGVQISNDLQEAKGSSKRFERSSVDDNIEKMALEQARREGKDSVEEIAARIERVTGADRARAEAKRSGRRVSDVAREIVEGKVVGNADPLQPESKVQFTPGLITKKPELAKLYREKYKGDAVKFLEGFESLSIEESPVDKPTGYTPKELGLLLDQAPTKQFPVRSGDGQLVVKYRGKERQLDVKALAFGEQHDSDLDRDTDERYIDFQQRIADVVGAAFSKLIDTPGVELDLAKIPPNTVIYRQKSNNGPRDVTWGQIAPMIKKGKRKGQRGGMTGFVPEATGKRVGEAEISARTELEVGGSSSEVKRNIPMKEDPADVASGRPELEETTEQGEAAVDAGKPVREKMEVRKGATSAEKGAKTTVEPMLSEQREQPEHAIDRNEPPTKFLRRAVRLIKKRIEKGGFQRIDKDGKKVFAPYKKGQKEIDERDLEILEQRMAEYETLDEQESPGSGVDAEHNLRLRQQLEAERAGIKLLGVEKHQGILGKIADRFAAATEAAKAAAKDMADPAQALVDELVKRFGMEPIKVLDDAGMRKLLREQAGKSKHREQAHAMMALSERLGKPGQAGGFAWGPEKFAGTPRVIYLADRLSMADKVEILAHEFGHRIFAQVKLSDAQLDAIVEAFHEWFQKRRGGNVGEVIIDKRGASDLLGTLSDPMRWFNASVTQLEGKNAAYWLDFEEFFADHVSRWFAAKQAPRSVLEKYFKGIADKLRELIAAVKKQFGYDVQPDKAVAALLDSLFDKTDMLARTELQIRADADRVGKTLLEHGRELGLSKAMHIAAHMSPTSPQANVAVHQALIDELTPGELKILGRTFGSGPIRRRLLELVPKGVKTAIQRNPEQTTNLVISYGYQLWKSGQLDIGPRTTTVFEGVEAMFAKAMGSLRREELAHEILLGMAQGITKAQKTAGSVLDVDRNRGKAWNAQARKTVQTMVDAGNKLLTPLTTTMTRIYDSGNPTLIAFANRFAPRVGEQDQAESVVEARNRRVASFGQRFAEAYKGLTTAQVSELMDKLNNPSAAPSRDRAVNTAMTRVRGVLEDMRDYATAGERGGRNFMGKIEDYFPWVFDMEKMQASHADFEALVGQPHYEAKLKKLGMSPAELYNYLIDHYGAADVEMVKGPVPYARNVNSRWLRFLYDDGTAADKAKLASFFSKNIDETLSIYTSQVVKRAEFAGVVGKKGEKLGYLRKDGRFVEGPILKQARKEGATDKDIAAAKRFVEAMMGSYGAAELHPLIKGALKLVDKGFGTTWADMDPKSLRKLQGTMIVYQNLRVLGFAALSTLPDVAGLLLRGDLDSAFEGFRTGVREAVNLAKGKKSDAIRLAEMVGTIESHAVQELLQQAYGSTYLSPTARKINDKWFNAIGVTYMTKLSRLMATSAAKKFIENQVEKPTSQTPRFLAELDLEPGDVQIVNGDLQLNDKVLAAINRYVDQTIIRPNASQRPLWGSHPDFAILFHLKQFMFSMEEIVLRRMAHEVAQGNISPVMTAFAGYITIAMLSDLVREELKFDEEDPRKKNWGPGAYVLAGVRRAGLFGTGELFANIKQEQLYGGTGVKAIAGPSIAQINELSKALIFGGRDEWRTALEAVPAANLLLENRIYEKGNSDGEAEKEEREAA